MGLSVSSLRLLGRAPGFLSSLQLGVRLARALVSPQRISPRSDGVGRERWLGSVERLSRRRCNHGRTHIAVVSSRTGSGRVKRDFGLAQSSGCLGTVHEAAKVEVHVPRG